MLALINKFSTHQYPKSVAFVSTNKPPKRKSREQVHLEKLPKVNELFRNKFNQNVKDLYTENCKMLMKEIKHDTNKWKNIHVHELKELILSKYLYFLKQYIDSVQSLSKLYHRFNRNTKILNSYKATKKANAIISKNNKTGSFEIPNFKPNYKSMVINAAQ